MSTNTNSIIIIIFIPTIFLLFTLGLKIFRNIPPKKPQVVKSLIEITFDWMILNVGLYASYAAVYNNLQAIVSLLISILLLIINFGCSQTALSYYSSRTKRYGMIWFFSILSYLISISFYIYIIIAYASNMSQQNSTI